MPRPRRSFTDEYEAQVVQLVRTSGRSIPEVCRELDLAETAVREWCKRADLDAGRRDDGLTADEREELRRLRAENRTLRMERELPKKWAAFNALDADPTR